MDKAQVIMIGPGRYEKGGVSAVVNTYFELGIEKAINIRYIDSYLDGNKIWKLYVFAAAYLKFLAEVSRCDIVHVHMAAYASFERKAKFVESAHKKGKKIIIHQHGGAFDRFYEEASDRKKAYIRKIFSYASKVFVMSEEWYRFFTSEICDRDQVEILYNGVVIPQTEEKDYGNHNLLFLGRLEEKKGVYELLRAMPEIKNQFPDVQLYMGGYGEQGKLEQFAKELSVSDCVHFEGWVKDEKKTALLEKCSLFVLPSYTEGLPVSVLEAMSFGLVTVATAVGGIPGIIRDGENGFLISPGSPRAISVCICDILGDDERKTRIGCAARIRIEDKFNAGKNLRRLLAVYEELE